MTMGISTFIRSFVVLISTALLISGCTTYEYNQSSVAPVTSLPSDHVIALDDRLLLDVGIVLFDAGTELTDDVSIEYAKVRASEAVWFSSKLKETLDQSRAWGMVRVTPLDTTPFDLKISGKLIESNGETMIVQVKAADAIGDAWLDNVYEYRASHYSYDTEVAVQQDPFQPLMNEVANDLYDVLTNRTVEDLLKMRQVSRLRFAGYFLPKLVDDYITSDVEVDGEGEKIELVRAPASDDPFMEKVAAIYDRNQLFLDVVQDYYRVFNKNMAEPYKEWRRLSYKEVQYERVLSEQARKEKIAGVALLVAGVVSTQGSGTSALAARYLGLVSGGYIFAKSYDKDAQASVHASVLRELGASLEGELAPSIVDLQDRTVTLGGTVEQQFGAWKDTMQRLFEAEFNLDSPDADQPSQPSVLLDESSKGRFEASNE
jgi:hypothetical protein